MRPDYGLDAPGVVRNLFVAAGAGFALYLSARLGLWSGSIGPVQVSYAGLGTGIGCGFMAAWMIYDSRVGKIREREKLLDLLTWRGDESVLDLGCGRGLLLVAAAKRLRTGKAFGIDLWQEEDLTGNRPEATLENARREGVGDRVEVKTGDMRELPFAAASFDRVVSNAAIHNIYDRDGRRRAIRECARVLKPGGGIVISDIRHVGEYAGDLAAEGIADVRRVGSPLLRSFLAVLTFGSLRPDTLVGHRPVLDRDSLPSPSVETR